MFLANYSNERQIATFRP